MKLSIIIPVYNEEKTISEVIKKTADVKLSFKKELIVVDDGSTDGTKKQLAKLKKQNNVKLKIITHRKNQGKGATVRTGIQAATGDYILIQDADLEYDPEEIPKLIEPLKHRNENVAVYGSRFKKKTAVIPILYLWGNKILTLFTNLLYNTKITDMETGYKLIPARFLKTTTLSCNHFDFEPEVTAKLVKKGYEIVEVPISYQSRSRIVGKKLTIRDAIEAVKTLLFLRAAKKL